MGPAVGDKTYDYVVIGAGSAGAIIASRLSEDPDVSVLLLEAGPVDKSLFIRMPAGMAILFQRGLCNWSYVTEPQAALGGRRIWTPRGKALGGSSSINGMIYIRGHALDYQRWAEEGASGWSYAEVLPYFRRLESHADRADVYHGNEGPVRVVTGRCENPLFGAFIEAGLQAGYPYTRDVNGYQQEGFGRFDMNVDRGRRANTSLAYLSGARARPNLRIETDAMAERIVFEGRAARGVTYIRAGNRMTARADCEVIVSAGAINTPKLLLASGIGPVSELARFDTDVVVDAPEVGRNLQDHMEVFIADKSRRPMTLYGDLRPWRQPWIGAQWLLTKTGKGATNHYEAGAFIRSGPGVSHPDIQIHFNPMAYSKPGDPRPTEHAYRIHIGTMRSQSRGTVTLKSLDPAEPPAIDPNYMSTEADWREMRACVSLGREIMNQPAFKDFRGDEIRPGRAVRTVAEIDAYIRETANTAYHPSGTCRMGSDDRSVVDPACRVRGVSGLRVVDASIMPSIVSGNLNVPTMMIGEKAADMIAGKPPPAPALAAIYEPDNWRKAQR